MFTGIVEELGEVIDVEPGGDSARLTIRGPLVAEDAAHGASIAVNGVCLTVTDVKDGAFTADVMKETLDRSSLGALRPGSWVDLERPVRLADRLGGHMVQGHVDGVGTIVSREPSSAVPEGMGGSSSRSDTGRWDVVTIALPEMLSRYVVEKGSIAVDGVSLTVVDVGAGRFSVALIPTTLSRTVLGRKRPGDPVNLEVDIVAKYVERLLEPRLERAEAAREAR